MGLTEAMLCAKGMLTRLPKKFDIAAAATIEVSRCLRIATVMAATANIIRQARPIPRDIGAARGTADNDCDAAKRDQRSQQGSQSRRLAKPDPGQRRGGKRLRGDDDRHIGHAGQLQRRNERHHGKRREAGDQPSVGFHPGQFAQAAAALRDNQKRRDEPAAKQSAPEQDRPGVVGSRRVNSGAVLQAIAAATTSAMPVRCWR